MGIKAAHKVTTQTAIGKKGEPNKNEKPKAVFPKIETVEHFMKKYIKGKNIRMIPFIGSPGIAFYDYQSKSSK